MYERHDRPSRTSRADLIDFLHLARREATAVLLEVLGRAAVFGSAKAVDVAVALGEQSRALRGRADDLTGTGLPTAVTEHFPFHTPPVPLTDEQRAEIIARHPAGKGLMQGW